MAVAMKALQASTSYSLGFGISTLVSPPKRYHHRHVVLAKGNKQQVYYFLQMKCTQKIVFCFPVTLAFVFVKIVFDNFVGYELRNWASVQLDLMFELYFSFARFLYISLWNCSWNIHNFALSCVNFTIDVP